MEKMTTERRNEIAYLYVRELVKQKGFAVLFKIKNNVKQNAIKITADENRVFFLEIARSLATNETIKKASGNFILGRAFVEKQPTETPPEPKKIVKEKKPILDPAPLEPTFLSDTTE